MKLLGFKERTSEYVRWQVWPPWVAASPSKPELRALSHRGDTALLWG